MEEKISLLQARKNAKLTQKEVGLKIYISPERLRYYERGTVRPSYAVLGMLCDLYGIKPQDLDIWTPDYFKHAGTRGFRP